MYVLTYWTTVVLFAAHAITVDAFPFGFGGTGGCGCCLLPCCQTCRTTTVITTRWCCRSCCGCYSSCSQTFIITNTWCSSPCGCCSCNNEGGGGIGSGSGGAIFGAIVPLIGSLPQSGGCGARSVLIPQTPQTPFTLAPLLPPAQLRLLPQSFSSLGFFTTTPNVQNASLENNDAQNAGSIGSNSNAEKSNKKVKSKKKSTTQKPEKSEDTEEPAEESDNGKSGNDNESDSAISNDSGIATKNTSGQTTNVEKSLLTTMTPKKTNAPAAFDDLYDDNFIVPSASRNLFFEASDISSESRKGMSSKTLAEVFEKRSRFFEKKKSHRQFSAPSIADGKLPTENANTKSESLCNSYKLARIMVKAMVSDVSISKRLIRRATEMSFNGKKFDVFCASGDFSYSIYAEQYCEATRGNITCFAFT